MTSENPITIQGIFEMSPHRTTENQSRTMENQSLTKKFLDRYYSLTQPDSNRKLMGSNDMCFCIFGYIPIIGNLFRWMPVRARRNSATEQTIVKPGVLSGKCLFDVFFCRWIEYLDASPPQTEEFNQTLEYENEYINIGLLSALVMQIVPSFFLYDFSEHDNESDVVVAYRIFSGGALISLMLSTALSIISLLMLGLTGSSQEANHFIMISKEYTYGLGPHSPLLFLYFGLFCTLGFIVVYLYLTHGPRAFIPTISTLVILSAMAIFFYFNGVGSLYAARVTQASIQASTQVSLSVAEVKRHLKELTKLKKGFENIESEDEFIEYTRLKSLEHRTGSFGSVLSKTCIKIVKEVFDQELKRQVTEYR